MGIAHNELGYRKCGQAQLFHRCNELCSARKDGRAGVIACLAIEYNALCRIVLGRNLDFDEDAFSDTDAIMERERHARQ